MTGPSIFRRGFTLIELLAVMAIISLLASMLMGILGIAQRQGRIANTRAVLMKVDQAVRLFRTDMRVYPWQTDLAQADADPALWTNDLGQRLAWKPSAADRLDYLDRFHADLVAIHGRFAFIQGNRIGLPGGDGSHAVRVQDPGQVSYRTNILLSPGSLREADAAFTATNGGAQGYIVRFADQAVPQGQVLSRLADEITSLSYISGSFDPAAAAGSPKAALDAPQGIDPALATDKAAHPNEDARYAILAYTQRTGYLYVPYNKAGAGGDDSRGPVLTAAGGLAGGWRADYLADALRRGGDAGRSDLDPVGSAILDAWGRPLVYVCAVRPGAKGYVHASDNSSATVDESRYGMAPIGRAATASAASDIRTTADPAFALEFELWSAGPDGRFAANRDDPANRDNIAIVAYAKGLP